MGFMEGFASGFANTFNAMEQRRTAAKQDAFRIAYDSAMKKKTTYDADAKADKAMIDSAKALTMQAKAPEFAWDHAYKLLKSGMSAENVVKQMSRTTFAVNNTPAMPEEAVQPASLTQQTEDGTKAAGLTMENEATKAADDQVAKTNPDLMGSIFGADGIFNPEANRRRQFERASQDVMHQTGMTQEEFDRINAGYKPHESSNGYTITDVRPEATNNGMWDGVKPNEAPIALLKDGSQVPVMKSPEGQWQTLGGRVIPEDQLDDVITQDFSNARTKAGNDVDALAKDYRESKANAKAMVGSLKDMSVLAQKNPIVIAKSAAISTVTNFLGNEFDAVFSQIGDMTSAEINKEEKRLISEMKKQIPSSDKNAADTQKMMSMYITAKFQIARLLNGSGNLANRDVQEAGNALLNTNDPAIFLQNAQQFASTLVNGVNAQGEELANSFAVQDAKSKKIKVGDIFTPIEDEWLTPQETAAPTPNATGAEPEQKPIRHQGPLNETQAKALGVPPGTYATVYEDGTVEIKE